MRGERSYAYRLKDIKPVGQFKRDCDSKPREIFVGRSSKGLRIFFHILWNSRVYINELDFHRDWEISKD